MNSHFHFLGICGTAMGAVAAAMARRGFTVTGSDANVYPPMSTFLEEEGITLFEGYRASNIPPDADVIVIGNAMSRGNEEVEAVLQRRLRYLSLPETMKEYFLRGKRNYVVTGTHGKTTTTSMLAWLMEDSGLNPSFMIGDLDFGMQHRTAVDDLGPFDTVHADRQIVRSLRMGLQQGGMNVEVGSHLFRHWQFVSRLLFCRSPHPTARQHTRSVLHREQHTSSGCFRQVNHSFVTGLVTALIQREREHRGGRRIALARMSPPIRPVDKNHTARSMSALRITHKNQILSPRRIIDTERYFGFPLRCSQRARCDHLGRSTLHITAQITGRTFPPPTPTEFVYLVLQFAFGKRLLLGIQRHDRKSQVAIRLELPIVQPNTDIRFIGRITHRTRSQALVTARLGDAREQVGLQHAGSRLVIHKTTVARNPSQRIELSGQYLIRRTGKGIKRIGENKVDITFERLRIVIESHFDLCIQSVRSRARQPMRFESDIRKIPAAQHIG